MAEAGERLPGVLECCANFLREKGLRFPSTSHAWCAGCGSSSSSRGSMGAPSSRRWTSSWPTWAGAAPVPTAREHLTRQALYVESTAVIGRKAESTQEYLAGGG